MFSFSFSKIIFWGRAAIFHNSRSELSPSATIVPVVSVRSSLGQGPGRTAAGGRAPLPPSLPSQPTPYTEAKDCLSVGAWDVIVQERAAKDSQRHQG